MTKQTKVHALAIALMAGIGIGAPLAALVANAPQARPAPALQAGLAEAAPELPAPAPEAAPRVVQLDDVRIVGRAPRAKAAPRAARRQRCHDHVLEQGGSPDHPTVRICVPAG